MPGRDRSGRSAPSRGVMNPSNNIDSIRTWSKKYSRWRIGSNAQPSATCSDGAQCAESGIDRDSQIALVLMNPVMPQQRVASA